MFIPSRLVQRLRRPRGGPNPFAFGGGLRSGGLSEEVAKEVAKVWDFDYMGRAEFEYGVVPKAMARMWDEVEQYTGWATSLKGIPVFVYSKEEHKKSIEALLREWARGKEKLKEPTLFKKSLEEAKPYFVGWMELDNAFMVFLDEEMWKGARKLVNPLEYGKGGVPNAFKQGE